MIIFIFLMEAALVEVLRYLQGKGATSQQAIGLLQQGINALSGGIPEEKELPDFRSRRLRKRPLGRGKRERPQVDGALVRMDGNSHGITRTRKKKKRRGRRRKKSLRKQIAQVKRLIPKMSSKTFRDFEMLCMATSGDNQHRIFEIPMFGHPEYEGYLSNLTLVDSGGTADYTTSNSKVKMSLYYKLAVKNNATSNAFVRYAFYKCTDNDNESIVTDILEELTDRGYTTLPSVSAKTAATATSSALPRRLVFDATSGTDHPYHVPVFGNRSVLRGWKQLGGVQTVVLGPGDTMDIIWSKKNFVYDPENYDQEPFNYLKNMSFNLLIDLQGSLAHDATNECLIGRTGYQLDSEQCRIARVKYANPKGLNEVSYTQDYPALVNFGDAQHAEAGGASMATDDK